MIALKNISKSFKNNDDSEKEILNNISFNIQEGEFITIFGPNGCGKSTLLNIIAKLDNSTKGKIEFKNKNEVSAYIFQDYKANLLPWKNVWQNIAQPLLWQGIEKEEAKRKVQNLLETLNIDIPIKAYPHTLSGGQSQLISILRSIIIKPTLLLADEPFSALDLLNRWKLSLFLRNLWKEYGFKCVFISHDIDEAILLGDRLILLSNIPTEIKTIVNINLPKERTKGILVSTEFNKIKKEILEQIKLIE